MLFIPFGEIPLLSAAALLGLSALWLCSVLVGLWASRAQRQWTARIGIAASLVIFLAGWLHVSPLKSFLTEAIYSLCYPANRHYFAPETAYAACAVILVASNAVGIVSIWASLGRPHWFFRVLAIAAIPPLLLLVRAYEPCFVFLVQSVVTVVPLLMRGTSEVGSRSEGRPHCPENVPPTARFSSASSTCWRPPSCSQPCWALLSPRQRRLLCMRDEVGGLPLLCHPLHPTFSWEAWERCWGSLCCSPPG